MLVNGGIDASTFAEIVFFQEVFLRISSKVCETPASYGTQMTRWFGATGADAVTERLKRFRSVANSVTLTVMQAPLKTRSTGVLGSATRPGARQDFSLTSAMHELLITNAGKNFTYKINSALLGKAVANTDADPNLWGQSCFANYVHEISHAYLGSHDVENSHGSLYGPVPHITWVAGGGAGLADRYTHSGSWGPFDTASCWGFFVEECVSRTGREQMSRAVGAARSSSMWSKPPMPKAIDIAG